MPENSLENVSCLFYNEKSEEAVYGLTPVGQPKVERLTAGLPCWKQPQQVTEKKKKTILLSDWTVPYLENSAYHRGKMNEIVNLITKLLEEGFELLYYDNNGILNQLTLETFDKDNIKLYFPLIPRSKVEAEAAIIKEKNIPKDKILILDDFWMNVLCSDNPNNVEKPRVLDNYVIGNAVSRLKKSSILLDLYINETKPAYRYVTPYVFDESAKNDQVIASLPGLKNFKIESKSYGTIYANVKNNDDIDNMIKHKDDLNDVQQLNLSGEIKDNNKPQLGVNILNLMSKLPNLNTIYLERINLSIEERTNLKINLSKVEDLKLSHCKLNEKVLIELMNAMPNLKKLNLSDVEIEGQIHPINSLSNIQYLELSNVIHDNNIEALLNSAVNLIELDHRSSKIKINNNNINNIIPNVSTFKLDLHQINSAEATGLFDRYIMPSLTNVNLTRISEDNAGQVNAFINTHAGTIKSLTLYYELPPLLNLVDSRNFSQTLSLLTNLEKLTIKEMEFNADMVPNNNLDKLKHLNLSLCSMSFDVFSKLIDKMPNLETINIGTGMFDEMKETSHGSSKLYLIKVAGLLERRGIKIDPPLVNVKFEDLPFDISSNLDFTPSKNNFSFNKLNGLDQDMIIDRLLQYMKTTESSLFEYQSKIKDGMCKALSKLFLKMDEDRWNGTVQRILEWNGELNSLTKDTLKDLKLITGMYKEVYLENLSLNKAIDYMARDEFYVGSGFSEFINSPKCPDKLLVINPWHAIAVKKKVNNWLVYDPNYSKGYKTFSTTKEVCEAVHSAIGYNISIELSKIDINVKNVRPEIKLKDDSAAEFVYSGGLHAVSRCKNLNKIMTLLGDLHNVQFDQKRLMDGLRVRNVRGVSAFAALLLSNNKDIAHVGLILLDRLRISNGFTENQFRKFLYDSMSAMDARSKNELLQEFIIYNKKYKNNFDEIVNLARSVISSGIIKNEGEKIENNIDVVPIIIEAPTRETVNEIKDLASVLQEKSVRSNKNTIYIEELLETWKKITPESTSSDTYLKRLTSIPAISGKSEPDNKRLIELSSADQVQALHRSLQIHCNKIKRPVFYVNSPEDLICSATYVKREKDDKGVLAHGPGGRLYDFLQANQDKANPPIIIVNYDCFGADDIVRFNGLLDKHRHADNTPLPECAIVIGLINANNPDCYQGDDFYSRFSSKEQCPISAQRFWKRNPPYVIQDVTEAKQESYKINLFNSDDWEAKLLGQYIIQGDSLYFKEGELLAALHSGLPVEIQNGPWNSKSFKHFWDQALLTRKIEHAGRVITLPPEFTLLQSKGYSDEHKIKPDQVDKSGFYEIKNAEVMNPGNFSRFFVKHQCHSADKTLTTIPGIIAENEGKTLHVNVTRDLTDNQWAELLDECLKHKVALEIHYAANIPIQPHKVESDNSTLIIESTDVDATVMQLSHDGAYQIIDITHCEPNDLLIGLTGELNKKDLRFEFNETRNALLKALDEKQNIILKGNISPLLADAISSILLERFAGYFSTEKLMIVSSDCSGFSNFPVYKDQVNANTKKELLIKQFGEIAVSAIEPHLEVEELCRLRARLAYRRKFPDSPSINDSQAWQGIHSLPGGIRLPEFNESHSKTISDEFAQKRLDDVNAVLAYSPYVFITGITGVGKSTFVEKYLKSESNNLYIGEGKIQEWAADTSDKQKILFIDEANMTSRQWSEFEGLFHHPPGMLINGQYYNLNNHKVVFAGNPLSYGGERKIAPLFERHGNALVFEPMPQEYIYENILKPIFAATEFQDKTLEISRELLNVYKFLCESSRDEVLISPREVQMMALLTLSHIKRFPNDNAEDVAKNYAYVIANQLTPENVKDDFNKKFSLSSNISQAKLDVRQPGYVPTTSRQPVINMMNDLLELREMRVTNANLNDEQKHGGLGGMVLEGEPGIGKSELVLATLLNRGYKEAKFQDKEVPEKAFYKMSVSMGVDEKKRIAIKSFSRRGDCYHR